MVELDPILNRKMVCPRCEGNGTVPIIPETLTRPFGRIRLNRGSAVFLRELLLGERDLLFEEKRDIDSKGQSSYDILSDIRELEKILRAVDYLIQEERWDAVEAQTGIR